MQPHDQPPEEYLEIAEKVRTGEYFREARAMYDLTVHDPMSERYLYLIITGLAMLIFGVAFYAANELYPLETAVPFIVDTNDIVEDLPRIHSLLGHKGEEPGEAMLRFLVSNYVTVREEYDITTFDRDVNGVKSQSTPEVYNEFQQAIDPRNPDSPITLYQRHGKRTIDIIDARRIDSPEFGMEVTFDASVEDKGEVKKSRWQADIAFNYNGVTLNEETGKVAPVSFVITRYRSLRLQDVQ